MNMISTGTFLPEMDASNKQETLAEKFAAVWEKKNSKAARAGGVSLMALSLAACGSSSDDTAAVEEPVVEEPVVEEPTTPVEPTPTVNTITKALLDFASGDTLAGTDGDDVLDLEINANLANTTTISGIETVNVTAYGALSIDFKKITDVDKFVSTGSTGQLTLNTISDASMVIGFAGTGTNDIVANYKAGTLTGADDTLSLDLSGASSVAIDADAGFENITVSTGGASSAAGQAATAASDINTLTVPGVTTMTISGAGALDIADGLLDGFTSVDASDMTGALTTGTASAATGFVDGDMVGATTGSTYILGSGNDNIGFTGAATTKSNSIKLGAGDDMILVDPAGNGAVVVLGEAGDDHIRVDTTALTTGDILNGGAGNDTVTIDVAGANGVLLREVENLVVTATATGTQTITGDKALAVTGKVNASPLDVASLPAGSTVTVEKAASTSTQATNVDVGFAAAEAASTIEVGGGMSGTLSLTKITDATVNLSAASDISGAYVLTSVKDFTLNATGALSASAGQNVTDNTGTNTLATVDINGTKAVKVGTITSTAMTTVSVDAASGDVTYAAIGGDSKKLASVDLSAAAGAIAGNADIGKSDNASALSVTASAKNAIDLGAIVSTKVGDVSITNTNALAKDLDVGAIGANATEIGAITMSGSGDVTIGLIGNSTPAATTLGAINLTSTLGKVDGGTVLTDVKAAGGIEVNLTAKTTIDSDGSGTAMAIENTGGNITGTLAGAAAAVVDYTAQTSGIVNLTASNTGGLTSLITNAGTAGAGETSTINLGNAGTGKTNTVTLKGTVDNVVINGGTGNDTIAFNATNDIATGTIALGTGTNKVDFTEVDTVSTLTDTTGENGIAINLSASTKTFDSGTAYASTVASGKAVGYDTDGDENNALQTSTKVVDGDFVYSLSGVTSVVGSDKADYIIANSTGTTIEGGAGNDDLVGGAGQDTFVFASSGANNGTDTITSFTNGASGDVLDVSAHVTGSTLAATLATGDATGDATITDETVTLVQINGAITAKDYAGSDFADIFAAANKYINTTVNANDDDMVIIVEGTDESHVLYVDATATTLTAAMVTQVATIDDTSGWHNDNIA